MKSFILEGIYKFSCQKYPKKAPQSESITPNCGVYFLFICDEIYFGQNLFATKSTLDKIYFVAFLAAFASKALSVGFTSTMLKINATM